MKINIILPFIALTGGIKFFFEHANCLSRRGHVVNVIYPIVPYFLGKSFFSPVDWLNHLTRFKNESFLTYPNWYNKKIDFNLKRVARISDHTVPNADVTLATAWPTAYDVSRLGENKGKKIYFVLHYESDMGIKKRIDETYALPLTIVALSNRTAKNISSLFKRKIRGVINAGVDLKEFSAIDYAKDNRRKKVLLYFDQSSLRKGWSDGLEALKITKKHVRDIDIQIFGADKPIEGFEDAAIVKRPVNTNQLRRLYSEADIFIYPSRHEGVGLPPMEAMACKCATVITNTGAVEDYAIQGKTALVVPPENPDALASGIIKLLKDEELAKEISLAGYNYMKNFSWEKQAIKFENLLHKIYQKNEK